MRVLVADDNPVFRAVLKEMLSGWGFEVCVASDGHEAWVALQSDNRPPLAILDWMMPGIDGVELCRRIRGSSGKYVYILIVTAKTSSQDLVEALEAGADDFVQKPLRSAELRARLRAGERIMRLQQQLHADGNVAPQCVAPFCPMSELVGDFGIIHTGTHG